MNEHEWQEVIGTIGIFVLLTAVIITVIWQFAISWRAKAQLARESEYRKVAESAVEGQQRIEQRLAEIGGQVTDLQSRTGSIERVLKDVE
ncbi:hypothetical protein AB0K64_13515 [Streptomyces sp. NPDC053741]|jgi:hypothetical protein|uniref:hypothetical protein n=1 Tax=Streptomyces TaxID=1883 RepID=UPI0026DED16C|nr:MULTISPECIES: hypothetical protein [Streptomyces]WKV78048.1 hypothetical protein HBB06_07790 [Streptomyces sp. SNU607]WSI17554.1 hypothetical protein OG336_11305 [[Kitasatospora] papulosa]WSZ50121.1 hypothetical protein OG337_23415 [[Kitasatospora] papulosa]